MTRNEAFQAAEKKIEEALRSGVTDLDLSCKYGVDDSEKLTALPESLLKLTDLHTLDLRNNRLIAFPESLGQLTRLHTLRVSNNQLMAPPESLGQLTRLHTLDFQCNQLTTLPDSLGQLIHLQTLDLSGNKLTTLPEFPGQLHSLDLSGNQLTTLPESIGHLGNLRSLSVWHNPLRHLPVTIRPLAKSLEFLDLGGIGLKLVPEWLGEFHHLRELRLDSGWDRTLIASWSLARLHQLNNEWTDLPSTMSQLGQLESLWINSVECAPELRAASEEGVRAVREYLRATAEAQIVLNEAKLILIGEGEVGKTSLLGALRDDDWVEDRPTTHGVEVDIKTLTLAVPVAELQGASSMAPGFGELFNWHGICALLQLSARKSGMPCRDLKVGSISL